jgi:Flp pilus assembly protein protease CpaA
MWDMDPSATWMDLILRMGIVAWLGFCAYYDSRTGEVPNLLTFPVLVFGGLLAGLNGWQSLAFYMVILLALSFLYFLGGMGGADFKILGALSGLWPLGLVTVLMGILAWIVGRRLLGQRGNFRAGLPIALAAAMTLLIDSLVYFS